MDFLKPATQEEIELETFKTFLKNKGEIFNYMLIEIEKTEPTDIRYDGINYQITIGDKKLIEEKRKTIAKEGIYVGFRNTLNIVDLILRDSLEKKSIRSDKDTTLLIEASSRGNLEWIEFEKEASKWVSNNSHLCNGWKEIYLVFGVGNPGIDYDRNIKIN